MILKLTKKCSQFLLILAISFGWIFSGWPQIFDFPPKPNQALAANSNAVSFIGSSSIIATNGGNPTAITPVGVTGVGDLMVFYHYSRTTGGDETVTPPTGFTTVFNSVTANYGLVAVAYRIKQSGDTTHTASVTNHTSGTTGETILEWIETYKGFDSSNPIVNYTASLSTWSSSLNSGPISAPGTATVRDGDMAVVFGGRFENMTGQTTTSGNNLMWGAYTKADSTLGTDASALTQGGLNLSGSDQTVSAKTITTTGTTQAGAGRMFIIQRAGTRTSNAVAYIGESNLIATDGTAPGAITPNSSSATGDLMVFYHYSRTTGGDETVTPPTGFTTVFNSVTANYGLVAVAYRIKQSGDTTHTASVTNHTTGTSGETIVEWIETYRYADPNTPIVDYTASLSTWSSSLYIGSIAAPGTATVRDGDMAVVFGGRFENITHNQTLYGDYLFWGARIRNDSSSGTDAAAVTQGGLNLSGSDQTVSAKTITTTGTTQAGAGRMFIIQAAPKFEQAVYKWFANADSTDVGSSLAGANATTTLSASGDAFRLRLLLGVAGYLPLNDQDFKLQFATRSGTCDTGFSGETYANVKSTTTIAFNTANSPADGDNLTANASDPTNGGFSIVNQDYEEANNFTNSVAVLADTNNGKWDFALIDNSAPADTAYCFRVRKSDETAINTYTVIPEIITASSASGTLTFSLSDNTIGFGALSAAEDYFATGDTNGSATETEAHTITASTNATNGYTLTVNGATLTSGSDTIDAIGGTNAASSVGNEQFGLRMSASGGDGAVSAPYADSGFAFDTASFPDEVASDADGDDVSTTYSVRYLANISAATEPGSYTSTMTYILTASF